MYMFVGACVWVCVFICVCVYIYVCVCVCVCVDWVLLILYTSKNMLKLIRGHKVLLMYNRHIMYT